MRVRSGGMRISEDVHPVIKVLAKRALVQHPGEVAVGRGDHAGCWRPACGSPPEPPETPVPQDDAGTPLAAESVVSR